ncbi:LacI family transcriptional regulator [Actinotalea sp. M2MS4P-6]|uniref:LacI family DNA-binding transcriptional regulator n=1 Tax=Actinotalea sp. M2MS4P-6 TaxID=2983762 RepID=UPI0021E429BC|nr:LacI family DNA-binding transcriptional regulator [Actinotalea sp. M2MS4P-6]MCV2395861.1 LacI family transcriptional regulator [Actinotalea sp. M2MS4P-6]
MSQSTVRGRGRAPTIRQVAAEAGVSRATASRVINGGHLVSPATRAAVEAAIERLGFTPNPVARSLATRKTGSVALVVPEPNTRLLSDPFFGAIINGLSLTLEQADLQMVLVIARDSTGTRRAARYLINGNVDGAVVASHHRDDSLNAELIASGLPLVFIGRPFDVAHRHYVDTDNALGARLATEHLLGTGHRRIATIAGPADMTAGIDRLAGWRAALEAAGLPADAVVHGDFTAPSGQAGMAELLEAHPDIDAVFAASDLMASGALRALGAAGRRVPEDVAVIGFDDIEIAESTHPHLSTVAQPVQDSASRAGRMLVELLADPDCDPDPVVFTPQLVLRETA